MNIIEVDDASDERLADYMRLRDVNLRKSLEAEHGLFMAEGQRVIRRALRSGYRPRSFMLTERGLTALGDAIAAETAPVYLVGEATARRLIGFELHRGALASFHRTPLPELDTVLDGARRIVVLEDLVDHTNVGAIFRSAAGLGVDAAVLAPRCADPLYRRSIKVSMGAVFTLPYTRLRHWSAGVSEVRRRGFTVLAVTPSPDAVPLTEALRDTSDRRYALLLGTEGEGLSARWVGHSDMAVRIPMAGREVDSLNVTAAAAIACYEMVRVADP